MTSFAQNHLLKLIKKNKMNIYDKFDETFALQKKILSTVCIKMTHDISEFRSKCWSFFYWFMVVNIILAIAAELGVMAVSVMDAQVFQDAVKMFLTMPCYGSSMLSIVKSTKVKLNCNVFENMYYQLREMWPRGELTAEEQTIVNCAVKSHNRILKGYYWINNLLLLLFIAPVYIIYVRWYLGYNVEIKLPFEFWMPFDQLQPIVYEFLLVIQTWEGTMVIWWNVAWDMLFCTYLLHITMQLDLVAARVRTLFYVPADLQLVPTYPLAAVSNNIGRDEREMLDSCNDKEREVTHQEKLIDIVIKHQSLISLACDAEAMFSFGLLMNFMYSSVMICFCGFCCILLEQWNEVAYKSYLLVVLAQTWLLFWYGQKLMDSSDRLSNALYESGWYNASQSIKSSILIMLQRSQNLIHVTTYGFSVVSMSSYSTIIKTSWSYFTLLLNFYTAKPR